MIADVWGVMAGPAKAGNALRSKHVIEPRNTRDRQIFRDSVAGLSRSTAWCGTTTRSANFNLTRVRCI
jgi:hypothetical protein